MVESQKMFEDMIRSIERMRSEVTKLIGINEKAAFNQAEALIERLEQEIDELKKKESGLKQLYSTEDHIHFLQVMCQGNYGVEEGNVIYQSCTESKVRR